jgi:FixJ family two-component response regulator
MPRVETEDRVLILAPVGRDAPAIAELLEAHSFLPQACGNAEDVCAKLRGGAGALLLTEEGLELSGTARLIEVLKEQPPWSELPIIIFSSAGKSQIERLLDVIAEAAGSITVLERPVSGATLLRSLQVALRSRRRQYEVRDIQASLKQSEERARQQFNELESIYQTAPLGLAVLDCGLRFQRINERLAQINGIPTAAHLGRTIGV